MKPLTIVITILMVGCIAASGAKGQDYWQSGNGPYSGTPIAFGADSSGNLFVSTRSETNGVSNGSFGVFRSTDHGATWQRVFNSKDFLYGFCTTPSGSIFLATISGGFRSDDNGETWQLKFPGPVRVFAYNGITSTLFAGTYQIDSLATAASALFKSTDNGDNWTYIGTGMTENNGNRRLVISKSGHMYLAGTGTGGVYRSIDNGTTWKKINTGLTYLNVRALHVTAHDSVFAGTGNGIFRLNSGNDTSWTNVTGTILAGGYPIFAITSQGSTILAGTMGTGLYRSVDYGNTWSAVSGLPSAYISALMYDRLNRMFVGLNQFGIYQSVNSGVNWSMANQGFTANSVLKLSTNSSGHIFAATDAGGLLRTTDNGVSWSNLTFMEGPVGTTNVFADAVKFVYVNPRNDDMYASLVDDLLNKSTDNGNSWNLVNLSGLAQYVGIDSIPNHLLSITSDGVFHSTDNGNNWLAFSALNNGDIFQTMFVAPNHDIYAGSNGGVYRSTNDGASWTPISTGLGNTDIRAIALSSQGYLVAGTNGGGMYRSTNNGTSWQASSITSGSIAEIQKLSNGNLIAATQDRGLLYSTDGMNWSYLNNGISAVCVPSVIQLADGTAMVGTYGDGIYTRNIFNTLSPTPFLTHNTGIIKTALTRNGSIGYVDDNSTAGDGFNLSGNNYLQVAGLVAGSGPTKISRHIRTSNAFKQADTTFMISSPGSLTREQGYVNFNDSLAPSPMGILIQQESYADNVSGRNGFVIFKYRIRNLNSTPINNFHIGLFSQWNLDPTDFFYQFSRADSARKLIYAENASAGPTRLFGTKVLSANGSTYFNVRSEADQTFTKSWNELNGASQLKTLDNDVTNHMLSAGSMTIPGNGYVVVGFAMLGGINTTEFLSRADSAQALWSRLITPAVAFSAGTTLNFSNTPVGSTNQQAIHITNTGDADMLINGFSIKDTSIFKINFSSSFTLAPSRDTVFTISFKPGSPIAYVDTLRTIGNVSAMLRLTGLGTAPFVLFSPATYDFGQQKLGTPVVTGVKLKNTGNGSLNVTDITIAPDTVFKVTSSKNFSVSPGDSTNISIQFLPTAENSYIDTLKVFSNTNTSSFVLKGTGTQLIVGFNQTTVGSTINFGSTATVTIKPSAFIDASGFARLFYKQGGAAVFDSVDMVVNLTDTTYAAQIPAGIIGPRGVAYYIKVKFSNVVRTAPSVNPATAPYTINVQMDAGILTAQNQPTRKNVINYRMISIPLDVQVGTPDSVLKNFGIGGKEWTLFRWQNGTYIQYNATGFQNFTPGSAYWFITTRADKLKSGSGHSVPIHQSFSIDLQTNWNMIGNPFAFNVAWSDVVKSGNVGPLWKQDISSGHSDYVQSLVLKPWEGYFVKNSNSTVESILIPPIENTVLGKLPKIGESAETGTFQKGEWQVNIRTRSGSSADYHNYIGMLSNAENAFDAYDLEESPRQPLEYLKLYFPHPDWDQRSENYGYDFRKLNPEGSVWDFEVNTNSSDEKVYMEFSGMEFVPSEFQLRLIDKDLLIVKNLHEEDSYIFAALNGKEIKRHFRLIVGTVNFIQQNDLDINSIPTQFDLSQNFPNPFNPTTTIKYALPFRSRVEIKIYNILGQEVKTLISGDMPAGFHLAIWDSKNNINEPVSSGIYIYRIVTESLDGFKQRYVKSKKMLLIK